VVGADIRVLVALEDDYRAYRETIAAVLRVLRPGAEVQSTTLEALKEELERFDAQVVICSGHNEVETDDSRIWIELSLDSTQTTKICIGGRHLELTNPTVEELLEVIEGSGNSQPTHKY
jgi:F420-dependent methylenetetrahydromethanopterin dehydrogenase